MITIAHLEPLAQVSYNTYTSLNHDKSTCNALESGIRMYDPIIGVSKGLTSQNGKSNQTNHLSLKITCRYKLYAHLQTITRTCVTFQNNQH